MDEKDFKWIGERLRASLPPELLRQINEVIGEAELHEAERKFAEGGKGLGLYILGGPEGHTPIPISHTLEWAMWFENNDKRRVANTSVNGWNVSTVFLGIDSDYFSKKPMLFETMIFSETETVRTKLFNKAFRKSMDNYCRRYATWDEAIAGHEEAVKMIREGAQ